MADGGPVTDTQVHRALLVGRYCDKFHCTPRVAEFELDNDPDQLGLLIIDVHSYLAAKNAFDGARDKVDGLKAWAGNTYMTLVETHTVEEREEREARMAAETDGGQR